MEIGNFWFEVFLIFILIIANAFFSGSEMGIVSARRSRIEKLSKEGKKGAGLVKKLKEDPDRFLATVQVGITIIGSFASAIGGVLAVEYLKPRFQKIPIPFIQNISEALSLAIVVIVLSYFILVFGELIPKSLALRYSESIACLTAKPIDMLSRLSSILIRFLAGSSRTVLKIFGVKEVVERTFVSEDEIKYMIKEGKERGIFDETEHELIHSVFEFTDTTVREVMVPRSKIQFIDIEISLEEVMKIMVEKGFSRYPVYKETTERIVGILYNKDVLKVIQEEKSIDIKGLVRKPFFVPETTYISKLLKDMQSKRIHMACVVNEFGEIDGLVTIEDLLEEIVGEIEDEYITKDNVGHVERLMDGSLVIDASLPLRDIDIEPPLPIEESEDYDTLAGFILYKLQSIPKGGEIVYHNGYKFTVVNMEGKRIARIKVEKLGKRNI